MQPVPALQRRSNELRPASKQKLKGRPRRSASARQGFATDDTLVGVDEGATPASANTLGGRWRRRRRRARRGDGAGHVKTSKSAATA
eukprot:1105617-Pleurochrysis_carterae.AAC.3